MRKFWFVYLSKALIVFPGGFGTFDELMEVLTLLQTHKLRKKITVLLYGREFWDQVINVDALVRLRLISPSDIDLFTYADSPEEAFKYLVKELRKNYPDETMEAKPSKRIAK
jgi:predicted Rossmann-fold nucleotide-binding protein